MKRSVVLGLLLGAALPGMAFAQERSHTVDEVVVVAPAGSAAAIDPAKLGSNVESLKEDAFVESSALSVTEALQRRATGVNVSDTQGNPFTGDVNFRGFGASPLQGSPQGIAVYMNGQRLNEAFGDAMNWDMIPQVAIRRADIFTSNPIYGLNALGGSIALHMKDGFYFKGVGASLEGGSFGSVAGSTEGGWNNGTVSLYGAIDGGQQDGWRALSDAKVLRGYADLGVKSDKAEFHLSGGSSASDLGVVGPTPVDLLEEDRTSIYTFPQQSKNRANFMAMTGSFEVSDMFSIEGDLHYRRFDQKHLDGNDGDFERCSGNSANALFGTLCLEDDAFPSALRPPKAAFQILGEDGAPIPCPTPLATGCNTTAYGTLDSSRTKSLTRGGSLQFVSKREAFGRPNHLIVGAAIDSSDISFSARSRLAIITPELEVTSDTTVPGAGQVIRAAGSVGYGPADISATNRQTGVYFSDTFDVTDRLFLTVGGRLNKARIETLDLTGRNPDLTARNDFSRFNPAVSLAFKASDALTVFGGYAESNRAPTPLELGCSDPLKPCLLENSLVADPPLKQVVAKTYELGGRGKFDLMGGRLTWEASAYRADNENDIVNLASALAGRGYFANVPGTRRTGIDATVDFEARRWSAYVAYSWVKAEYRFNGVIASPNNPEASDEGDIEVESGDRLGGIPPQRIKIGGEFDVTEAFQIGGDVIGVSSQYFVGDEGNDNDKLPAYWVANLRADHKFGDKVSLFARVDNLFDKKYATFGTYFDPAGVERISPNPLPDDPNPRTVTPAAPRRYSVGVRLRF